VVVLPSGNWSTILDFLVERFPYPWPERFSRGEVLDEQGEVLSVDAPFQVGKRVYYFRNAEESPIAAEETVLFQDDHLVVADKPHFLAVTPTGRHVRETLLVRLKHRLGLEELTPIHRIDRDTRGLVVFSVLARERSAYQALFRDRKVKKVYEAWAPVGEGFPRELRGRFMEREDSIQMMAVPGDANAITWVERVKVQEERALYRLFPSTGCKHQLRVQMADAGLPIENDRIYPTMRDPSVDDLDRPLQLWAKEIGFDDPVTAEERYFRSGLAWT